MKGDIPNRALSPEYPEALEGSKGRQASIALISYLSITRRDLFYEKKCDYHLFIVNGISN